MPRNKHRYKPLRNTPPGPATDSSGQSVVDPTNNVIDLVDLSTRRIDDLRNNESKHIREILRINRENVVEIRRAEASRIDANRATDIAAVAAANAVSVQQANTLAAQVSTSADAQRSSLANALEPIQKDISEIRKTQYEAAGGKLQQTETKISVGQIAAIISLIAFLVFGGISSLATIIGVFVYFNGR